MEADHKGVCKFASAEGDDYEQVSFNLVRLVKAAIKAVAERAHCFVKDPQGDLYSTGFNYQPGTIIADPDFSGFSSMMLTGRQLQLSERSRVTASERVRIASTRGFMGNQHTASRGPFCKLFSGRT
jgi:hypothetical protein